MDKINELTNGEKAISLGGILMLVASFLPWYKVSFSFGEFGSVSASASGWEAPGAIWSILAVIIAVAMAGVVLAAKFGNVQLPDLGSFTWGQALLAGGGAVVVLIVLKLINESSSLSYGFYLGVIAAALLAAGGYLRYQETGGMAKT
ncbi:MAG TPA: hypothetical protein VNN10_12735 [Dehalococcoidia bacterium]|nr:hypothetical protein [Dehalococcoidia bacterium]